MRRASGCRACCRYISVRLQVDRIAASCTALALRQVVQRLLQAFGVERHLLAHGERRGLVIDAEGE